MTVRFEEPPLPGIRMYFCQHLTPEYVWRDDLMGHRNRMRKLMRINAYSPDPAATAACIATIADAELIGNDAAVEVSMPNLRLRIDADSALAAARLHSVTLLAEDDSSLVLDLTKDALSD